MRRELAFFGFCADKGVIQLRQRVEASGLLEEVVGLRLVAFGLVGLAQAVENGRILLVGLLQFGDRGVVIFLRERESSGQFASA